MGGWKGVGEERKREEEEGEGRERRERNSILSPGRKKPVWWRRRGSEGENEIDRKRERVIGIYMD